MRPDLSALRLEGRTAAAEVRASLARLLASVDSVERDAARAESQKLDPAPALARLKEAADGERERLTSSRAEGQRIQQERAAAERQLAGAQEQRNTATAREAELTDAAFLQAGDARFRSLSNAGTSRSEADAAASLERTAEIQLAQLEREADLATSRSSLAERGVARLEDASKAASEAGVAAGAAVTEASGLAAGGATSAADTAEALAGAFRERALARLDAAAEAAAQAVGRLERSSAEALVLAEARLTEADTRATAAGAAASVSATLLGVAERVGRVNPTAGGRISALATGLREEAVQRREAAAASLATARTSLDEAPADEAITATLREVATRVDTALSAG